MVGSYREVGTHSKHISSPDNREKRGRERYNEHMCFVANGSKGHLLLSNEINIANLVQWDIATNNIPCHVSCHLTNPSILAKKIY